MMKFKCNTLLAILFLGTSIHVSAATVTRDDADVNAKSMIKKDATQQKADFKKLDKNNDGMISKDEYMHHQDPQSMQMKKNKGATNAKDLGNDAANESNRGSMNNKPIGTTTGESENGSVDITKDGSVNGTQPGTN